MNVTEALTILEHLQGTLASTQFNHLMWYTLAYIIIFVIPAIFVLKLIDMKALASNLLGPTLILFLFLMTMFYMLAVYELSHISEIEFSIVNMMKEVIKGEIS